MAEGAEGAIGATRAVSWFYVVTGDGRRPSRGQVGWVEEVFELGRLSGYCEAANPSQRGVCPWSANIQVYIKAGGWSCEIHHVGRKSFVGIHSNNPQKLP